ncbi:MAG: transcriptional regulator [Arcobacter sp.]|nr:MAG: transcriptional regulator [Arcobacter sp.]
MNDEQLSKCLAELGNITRLKIFKLLVKAGEEGLPVGTIQEKLNVPGSTLSHHITKLMSANLVIQRREGRTLFCTANYEVLNEVVALLKDQCCVGI